jgi:threonine/homoserine/homoserine lactone efflux protein
VSELLVVYGTFMLISLSGALSPGPLTAVSISEGARAGRWAGARLALGHGLIEIPLVFGIAYGLGMWLRQPNVSGLIGLIGSGVLIWMGYGLLVGAWKGRLRLRGESVTAPAVLRFGPVPGGMLLTLSNPYWSLWWASFGAAYVARVVSLGLGPLTVGGLALTHWLIDLVWLGGLSYLMASGRGLIGERGYRIVLLVCGGFLLVFGVALAWSGLGFFLSHP